MGSRTTSIVSLLNEITQERMVLPDLQRDFVWHEDQIRLLFDTLMRGYPFGALLIWNTQFLEVPYREFARDFRTAQTFTTRIKPQNEQRLMVLDGQQRLQSLYIALHGRTTERDCTSMSRAGLLLILQPLMKMMATLSVLVGTTDSSFGVTTRPTGQAGYFGSQILLVGPPAR